ncbi:hypothetical protein B0H16DRAFT_1739111 [Mycena metata]|uniref:NOT2/NOT3/NOT5 C-terminal domain-containing protein n=1 Tax=Mycena metata TaxID=1033252 RepID=A0AAD7MK19_9AGAR|nr:hypothetical protein B0H16DRAFT_1739111 [Mycena metata]
MNRPSQQRAPSQQQAQYRQNPQPTAPYTQYPIQQRPGPFLPQPQRVPLTSPFMPPRPTNGTTQNNFPFGLAGLPPHLQQQQQQQQTQGHDAALDPNDFPALGAPPAANNASSTPQSTSSYASAGAAPTPAPHVHPTPARDLTQDDFPALGENAPTTAPPGLFPAVPGMLNLGMMGRHPGPFEEKRHTNPPNPAPPTQSKANPPQQPPTPSNNAAWPNGAQDGSNNNNNNNGANTSHPSSGVLLHAQQQHAQPHHPQTPAQQVLVSAADRWGLLGLLAMIREAGEVDFDSTRRLGVGAGVGSNGSDPRGLRLSGVGTDLGTMGLDMGFSGNLYSTFITPWADQSAAHVVEPEFHLPACYASVHAPPPGPSKASAFSDETLFFMFYSSARDALQEVAAQELCVPPSLPPSLPSLPPFPFLPSLSSLAQIPFRYLQLITLRWNRNWRYHKDLRLWITKESGTAPSAKVPGGEQGLYTIWDADAWAKEHKEMSVLYAELEEKSSPAFVGGPGLVLVGAQNNTQGQLGGNANANVNAQLGAGNGQLGGGQNSANAQLGVQGQGQGQSGTATLTQQQVQAQRGFGGM